MLWSKKISYKEFDNEKKIPAARKFPTAPTTFLMVRPLHGRSHFMFLVQFCIKMNDKKLLINEMGQNHITVSYHNTSITTGKITTHKLVEEIRMSWRIMATGCDR